MRAERALIVMARYVLVLLYAALCAPVQADTRHVRDYDYDASGHASDVEAFSEEGAPLVESLSPDRIAVGVPRQLRAQGQRLLGVEVSSEQPGLQVGRVRSSRTAVEFRLSATSAVPPGRYALRFVTGLGSTTRYVRVRAPVPRIEVYPFPIVLSRGGQLQLEVLLSFADTEAHTVGLSLTDSSVVSLAATEVQIAADTRRAVVALTGLSAGATRLALSSALLESLELTVWVGSPARLSAGRRRVDSPPLGVTKGQADALSGRRGPLFTRVGVQNGPVAVPPSLAHPLYPFPVGVAYGPLLYSVSPAHLVGGQSSVLEVKGAGLETVSRAELVPAVAGLTAVVESAQSDTVRLRVTAPLGESAYPVRLRLLTATDTEVAAVAGGALLRVNPGAPLLHSITPSRVLPGEAGTLTLRGVRLLDVLRVEAAPGTGIRFGTVQPQPLDGRVLDVDLSVSEDTPAGVHVVRVHTLSGDSGTVGVASNTLHVIAGPARVRVPIVSVPVGVQVAEEAPAQSRQLYPLPVGVAQLPIALSVLPPEVVRGTNTTLRVQGAGLASVQGVNLSPSTGVVVGTYTTTSTELSLPLTIATDAAPGPRRIHLSGAESAPIDFADPRAGVVQVVATAVPRVRSLSPTTGRAGESLELLVSGVHLTGARVQFSPATGLRLGTVRVTADGLGLRVQLNLAADASPGARVLVVQTLVGSSTAAPLATNTFTVMPASLPVTDP